MTAVEAHEQLAGRIAPSPAVAKAGYQITCRPEVEWPKTDLLFPIRSRLASKIAPFRQTCFAARNIHEHHQRHGGATEGVQRDQSPGGAKGALAGDTAASVRGIEACAMRGIP